MKYIFRIPAVAAASAVLCAAAASCSFSSEMASLRTLRCLSDGVFFIEYAGNYRLDDYIQHGGGRTNEEMSAFITECLQKGTWTGTGSAQDGMTITEPDFACSSIVAQTPGGGAIYGRNYDWDDCAIIIVHTKPDDGYESVSTSCLSFLGLERDWQPAYRFPDDMTALAAIYVPLDGMNEKGLYISDLMAGDAEQTAQETGKPALTTTAAIRLVLDKAATVDEATALLQTIDMHSVIGKAHHFAIADATGKSVVAEYVRNQLYVSETPVLTNHYTAQSSKQDDGTDPGRENSRTRFAALMQAGEHSGWQMDAAAVRDALDSVNAARYSDTERTMWSTVLEPEQRTLTYYIRGDFARPFVVRF